MKTNKIFIVFLFIIPVFTQAQEVFDLSKCIITGLEQNYSLQVVRNQEAITENNYTLGNAGYLPTITTTNRFGGNTTSTTQNMNDGSQKKSNGVYNTTGSAALNLNMTIFNGFNVRTTYQKLNELKNIFISLMKPE